MKRRAFLLAGIAGLIAPRLAAGDGAVIGIEQLYNSDATFSELATANVGQRLSVVGFMAPPLQAAKSFFVLTTTPMATCPFCDSEAEWAYDILPVYTKRPLNVLMLSAPIVARGVLELGTVTDPDTGFVSKVRLSDATYDRFRG